MKKKLSMLVAGVLLLGTLTGCTKAETSDQNTDDPIKVALVGPMTGSAAQYGEQFKRGVELFVEEYNEKGGFEGREIEVTTFDDKNDAKEAATIANKIVAEGDYFTVIGPFSSTSGFAMAEILSEEGILHISPTVSHPEFVTEYDNTFRMYTVNSEEAKFAAKYLATDDEWGSKEIAAIYSNNDWGLSVDKAFEEAVAKEGASLVANESFIIGETKDFSSILTKIKDSGAKSIYFIGQYSEAGQVLLQIADMEWDVNVLISASAYKTEVLDIAGDAAKDARWAVTSKANSTSSTGELKEFEEKVQERYGVKVDDFLFYANNAMQVAFTALDNVKEFDMESIKNEILRIGTFQAVNGEFTINSERNIERPYFVATPDGPKSFKILE